MDKRLKDIDNVEDFVSFGDIKHSEQIDELDDDHLIKLYNTISSHDIYSYGFIGYAHYVSRFLLYTRKSVLEKLQQMNKDIFPYLLAKNILSKRNLPEKRQNELTLMFEYVFDTFVYPSVLKYPETTRFAELFFMVSYDSNFKIIDMFYKLQQISINSFVNMSSLLNSVCHCNTDYDKERMFTFIKYLVEDKKATILPATIANFALKDANDIFLYLLSKMDNVKALKNYGEYQHIIDSIDMACPIEIFL